MFNRKQIKKRAKTALKRRYWMVLLVVALLGLLGGTLADGWGSRGGSAIDFSGISTNVNLDWLPALGAGESTWQPTLPSDNPWEQYAGNADLGAVEGDLNALWQQLQAEWNAWTTDFETQWNTMLEEAGTEWSNQLKEFTDEYGDDIRNAITVLLVILVCVLVVVWLISLLIRVLFTNVVSLSGHGWMLRHLRGEKVGLIDSFAAFRIYKASVRTMFLRDLLVWLWSLLLFIPGVVMRYAYSMVPYIIYENPHLSAARAAHMSRIMTRGYKWKLFILRLSFIGWQLLSIVTGGLVGLVWTNPYRGLAHAAAYEDLKWNAIHSGKLTWEDFDQDPPAPLPEEEPVVEIEIQGLPVAEEQPVSAPLWESPVPQWEGAVSPWQSSAPQAPIVVGPAAQEAAAVAPAPQEAMTVAPAPQEPCVAPQAPDTLPQWQHSVPKWQGAVPAWQNDKYPGNPSFPVYPPAPTYPGNIPTDQGQ